MLIRRNLKEMLSDEMDIPLSQVLMKMEGMEVKEKGQGTDLP